MEWPCTRRSAMSSRSANERERPESGFADVRNIDGGMPPAFLNHRVPTACGTPASTAAASLALPAAIAAQNRHRSSRPATGGRPGETMPRAQIDPNAVSEPTSQPPPEGCCDDRLNPPCTPRSLWCTRPPWRTGRRSHSACSSASSTKSARAERDTRHPTMRRAKASMTKAT